MASVGDYNTRIIEEFRATGGHPGGEWAGTAIVASSGGSPTHPHWYHNLKANPRITVEVGTETFTAVAEELAGTVRAELWPRLVARYPTLGVHQAKTTRQFPVLVLTRQD